MASERQVFAQVVGGQSASLALPEEQSVELFEVPTAAAPVANSTLTAAVAATTLSPEPVVAPQTTAPPPQVVSHEHLPPANLGANVELF